MARAAQPRIGQEPSFLRQQGIPVGMVMLGSLAAVLSLVPSVAAADQTLVFDGEVSDEAPDHVFIDFEVPAGTAEIEVQHDDLAEDESGREEFPGAGAVDHRTGLGLGLFGKVAQLEIGLGAGRPALTTEDALFL